MGGLRTKGWTIRLLRGEVILKSNILEAHLKQKMMHMTTGENKIRFRRCVREKKIMYTHLPRKKIPNHPHLPQKSNGHICRGCATFHWTKFLQVSDGLWKSIFMSAVMNYKGKPSEIYSTLRNSFRTVFFQLILFPEFSVE